MLGTPNEESWPGFSQLPHVRRFKFVNYPISKLKDEFRALMTEQGFDLLRKMLIYDPEERITAEEALNHAYFREDPAPKPPSEFPTWPSRSDEKYMLVQFPSC
jgi:cell division cycle 2-like protein